MTYTVLRLATWLRPRGRVSRRHYWFVAAVAMAFAVFVAGPAEAMAGRWGAVLLFLPVLWVLFCLMSKRCHDIGRSAKWLVLLIIPIIGIVWAVAVLGFRRGQPGPNQYGADPHTAAPDYLSVGAIA